MADTTTVWAMSRKSVRPLRPHNPSRKSHVVMMKQHTHSGKCSNHSHMARKVERDIHQMVTSSSRATGTVRQHQPSQRHFRTHGQLQASAQACTPK